MILCLAAAGALAEPSAEALRQRAGELLASPRLRVEQAEPYELAGAQGLKVIASFEFFDPAGKRQTARGKFILPQDLLGEGGPPDTRRVPLLHGAGYEVPDPGAAAFLKRGFALVTPTTTELNPMSRTANLDVTLLHIARSLPFVDDARVMITGGSAGGYTTLMMAAETFPLAAAVPIAPPLNWGYNAKYFLHNNDLVQGPDGKPQNSPAPGLAGVCRLLIPQCFTYYPEDTDDPAWFNNSPIAHADTITAPVLMIFSTGDILVPIYQVGRELVRPHDAAMFPSGYEIDPERLADGPQNREELLTVLGEEQYALTVVPVDPAWPTMLEPGAKKNAKKQPEGVPVWTVPFRGDKQWDIVVIDEGPVHPAAGHFQHLMLPNYDAYLTAKLAAGIAPEQLTARKLERLMSRYASIEWLESGMRHLDTPEAERADVVRGLRTYVGQGDAHAKRFAELYAALPHGQQAFGPADRFDSAQAIRSALESFK